MHTKKESIITRINKLKESSRLKYRASKYPGPCNEIALVDGQYKLCQLITPKEVPIRHAQILLARSYHETS